MRPSGAGGSVSPRPEETSMTNSDSVISDATREKIRQRRPRREDEDTARLAPPCAGQARVETISRRCRVVRVDAGDRSRLQVAAAGGAAPELSDVGDGVAALLRAVDGDNARRD